MSIIWNARCISGQYEGNKLPSYLLTIDILKQQAQSALYQDGGCHMGALPYAQDKVLSKISWPA